MKMLTCIMCGLIVLLTSCNSNKRVFDHASQQVTVEPAGAAVMDRDLDGVITDVEFHTVTDNPSSLSVFIWLVVAVLVTVLITMLVTRKKPAKHDTPDTSGPGPVYQDKTTVVSRNRKPE